MESKKHCDKIILSFSNKVSYSIEKALEHFTELVLFRFWIKDYLLKKILSYLT